MYNRKLKEEFIFGYTENENTIRACLYIFNAFEPYEIEWGADLCTRNVDTLQPVIDNLVGLRMRSKWARLIILRDYVRWCINKGVPNVCDGMLRITTVGLTKVKQQTVANPLHLQKYLDSICEPEAEKTVDNSYRCFYWLAYSGITENNILNIRCKDVDIASMVVHCNNEEYPIYREALPAFKNCVELSHFVFKHPNYSKPIYKPRAEGDILVRGVGSEPSTKIIKIELSRRSKTKTAEGKTDLKLSYFRIWISGLFYRTYENERAGIKPDFSEAVALSMRGKTYKLESGRNTIDAKKRQLAKDFIEDYERWKMAYTI